MFFFCFVFRLLLSQSPSWKPPDFETLGTESPLVGNDGNGLDGASKGICHGGF